MKLGWVVAVLAVVLLYRSPSAKPPTVVVLGSSDSERRFYRVKGLLRYLLHHPAARVIFTGRGEAPRMAELYQNRDRIGRPVLPDLPIVVENQATNTRTNIERVAALLHPGERVVLISDHDHVRGAAHCLQKLGFSTSFYIVPEPHRGYAEEAGYLLNVDWEDLPEPVILESPRECERGYYFFCCGES